MTKKNPEIRLEGMYGVNSHIFIEMTSAFGKIVKKMMEEEVAGKHSDEELTQAIMKGLDLFVKEAKKERAISAFISSLRKK